MPGLIDFVPNADALVEMPCEELAMILLQLIQQERGNVTISHFEMPLWNANVPGYGYNRYSHVQHAIAEAWQWLLSQHLLMPAPDQPNGFFRLTRKGAEIKSGADAGAYSKANLLPEAMLHPKLREIRSMFIRGDYVIAVQQAFTELEINVREASGLSNKWVGAKLMREAFKQDHGKLTNMETEPGERVAVMELFAGAFGHGRNPPSHRRIELGAVKAAQLIGLASYLLTFVEEAKTRPNS
jgi:uncharacterized protein (TIGR02391 family)